jgi:uncharacterized protein (DUF427 family)
MKNKEKFMSGFPELIFPADRVESAPRRIRALLHDQVAFDTTAALYVWDSPYYPQYYVPVTDVDSTLLVDEDHEEHLRWGTARRCGLRAGDDYRAGVAHLYTASIIPGIAGTVRFDWSAFESWFEEDEEIFVHPRNPYARVDALRSTRLVQIQVDGTELAKSSSTVMVFETGLPTRFYFNRTEVDFQCLVESDTASACPYKGETSAYWSGRVADRTITDIAWSYGYPTWQLQPIAGLVAFYNEKVDILVDGERLGKDVMASPEAYRGLMKMETRTSSWYRSAVRSGS